MRVLVTGGTGFIGSHLVTALLERDHDVVTMSRKATAERPGVEHCVFDLMSAESPAEIGPLDAIVHLAGLADASSSRSDPVRHNLTNAVGTLKMLELARSSGARFVLASSQRVYQPGLKPLKEDAPQIPVDPYGYSKLVAEQWVEMYRRLYRLPATTLRFFSVYGPGQAVAGGVSGVVAIFVNLALSGQPLHVIGDNLRDFTYVSDVVTGILLAVERPGGEGGTYNIATGAGTLVSDLARAVREITGSRSEIVLSGHEANEHYVADISRARRELGYEPQVGLRQGLERYVEQIGAQRPDPAQSEADAGATG